MKAIIYFSSFFFLLCILSSCQKNKSTLEDDLLIVHEEALSAIRINEFVGKGSEFLNEFGEEADWIELYNPSEDSIILEADRWHLSDDLNKLDQFTIYKDIIIPAKGHLVIWADGFNLILNNVVHTNFKLNNEGEQITLCYTNNEDKLQVIDIYNFGPLTENNVSFGRLPDGSENWTSFAVPSPNAVNN